MSSNQWPIFMNYVNTLRRELNPGVAVTPFEGIRSASKSAITYIKSCEPWSEDEVRLPEAKLWPQLQMPQLLSLVGLSFGRACLLFQGIKLGLWPRCSFPDTYKRLTLRGLRVGFLHLDFSRTIQNSK